MLYLPISEIIYGVKYDFMNFSFLLHSSSNPIQKGTLKILTSGIIHLYRMKRYFLDSFTFLDAIMKTLRGDGKILVPVDTAGRVLELLLILEQVSLFNYRNSDFSPIHDICCQVLLEIYCSTGSNTTCHILSSI